MTRVAVAVRCSDCICEASLPPGRLNISAMWTDPAESEMHIIWARDFWSAMLPYSAGGVYVNFLNNEGEDRVKAAYDRPTYARLVALKNKYDPTNLFPLNQNIRLTASQAVEADQASTPLDR